MGTLEEWYTPLSALTMTPEAKITFLNVQKTKWWSQDWNGVPRFLSPQLLECYQKKSRSICDLQIAVPIFGLKNYNFLSCQIGHDIQNDSSLQFSSMIDPACAKASLVTVL